MPSNLSAEVLPLRDRGHVLVDSAVGALPDDLQIASVVALDSGATYVLLAECDCEGMSIMVVPYKSFLLGVVPSYLNPGVLDEAHSRTPRLRFVVSETREHTILLRMSDCTAPRAAFPKGSAPEPHCRFGFYLFREPASPDTAPARDP